MKFYVFGTLVQVSRVESVWRVCYFSTDGKRRPATDIVVPAELQESEIEQYLGDLCHEWATERHPAVIRLD